MKRELTTADLELAWQCVGAAARAYSMATIESDRCHILQIPLVLGPPEWAEVNILACRGSACVKDWIVDAQAELVDLGIVRVHAGFWKSANSILDQVLKLDQREHPAPVVLTGHSKGAAEAMILAWQLVRCGRTVLAVHTFGGPRVGNSGWRSMYGRALGELTTRWVHEEDIVPRMPPWISGYRHGGHEAFFSAFGGFEMDPSVWRLAASDIWGTFWGYRRGQIEQVADHLVQRYVEHLEEMQNAECRMQKETKE